MKKSIAKKPVNKTKADRIKAVKDKGDKPKVNKPKLVKAKVDKVKADKVKVEKFQDAKFKKVSKAIANSELEILCSTYPEAECELIFESPFQLLTAVIMSAQTTDANVNRVAKNLFKKYPDAKSLALAPLDDLKEIIKSTGYYNAKATNIQNCAIKLVKDFNAEVPKDLVSLVSLPGVGRKTANVVLGVAFGVPGWTVDTHVQRLAKRLGLSNENDPEKIEYALQKIFPGKDWSKLSITLIWHGRRVCFARKPNCAECPINHLCPSSSMPC